MSLDERADIRGDYRHFDMARMRYWGHNAFWWPRDAVGERACIFGPRPKIGDVLSVHGTAYAITEVDTPSDPGDQHFVSVANWGSTTDLPPSTRVERGLIE